VTTQTFTVTLLPDFIPEDDRDVELTLSSPTGAMLGTIPVALLQVLDDDRTAILLGLTNDTSGGLSITSDGRLSGRIREPGQLLGGAPLRWRAAD
jgi:hypothetical protein